MLCKLFFWDAPAQGAFFALTFFFVCSVLWFTLYQMVWLSDCGLVQLNIMSERFDCEIRVWKVGQLLIALYSAAVFLPALLHVVQHSFAKQIYSPLYCVFPAMLEGLCALYFCIVPFFHLQKVFSTYWWSDMPCGTPPGWLPMFSSLPPQWWGVAYFAAVLVMAASGYLVIASFAHATAVSLRQAFCTGGIALWMLFGVAYLVLLGLALKQSRCCAATRSRVEAHFGHPLTAGGLQDYYAKQGETDDDFWKRQRQYQEKLPRQLSLGNHHVWKEWDGRLPDNLTPEILSAFENYCKSNEGTFHAIEKGFDSVPPLPQYNFTPGSLETQVPGQLNPCWEFMRWEMSRLNVFLKKHDKQNTLLAYQRIVNCAMHLQREPFLFGSLVWVAAEHIRLDAMERLLESRLLSDDELQNLAVDLTALETRIPVVQRQAMYTEATFGLDTICRGMEAGKAPEAAIAFEQLRFFYPQLWLQAALDKENILQMYLAEDFSSMKPSSRRSAYIFSLALIPVLQPTGNKFKSLTARTRAMQALLRAEAYRREHGDFPETMPDLPTDPYSGKPLLYKYGINDMIEYALPDKEETSCFRLAQSVMQRKCVKVWSVGPNSVTLFAGPRDVPCAKIKLE